MLKQLILKNVALIDEAELTFEPGFTIISGETGAGKTALIQAIGWILGDRIESSRVRHKEQKALVQAAFECEKLPPPLSEAGLDIDLNEPLIIQREISPGGKSRAFIQGQLVPLSLLQALAPYLMAIVDQEAPHTLRTEESQRASLDLYGDLLPLLEQFQASFTREKEAFATYSLLQTETKIRDSELEKVQHHLEELKEADIQIGEEEKLFSEYRKLASFEELHEKSSQVLALVSAESNLSRAASLLSSLSEADPSLSDTPKLLQDALLSLREISHSVSRFQGSLEDEPQSLAFLEERLSLIEKLKRKHSRRSDELPLLLDSLLQRQTELLGLDDRLLMAEEALAKIKRETKNLSELLSLKRKEAALSLEEKLTEMLQNLNMPFSGVHIALEKSEPTLFGEDKVTFFLKANQGEKFVPVAIGSSGGELARLYLSLTLILAEKNQPTTLIFDEIDANVGGKTATLIGEQLKALGQVRQVLCITHFPQVASQGDHHFHLYKEESEGRTLTRIEPLSEPEREQELLRMLGN